MAKIVFIGGSTGAPSGLLNLLKALPEGFCTPIVVALHMPEAMTASYVKSLDMQTPFNSVLAKDNARVEPGFLYLAPGGLHVGMGRTGRLVVSPKPVETFFKPSIDVLFYTAARALGSSAVAVVLTGLSARRDAVEGALAVQKARGTVLVFADPSSKFLGMPKNVIDAGAATEVLSATDLPKKLALAAR